VTPSEVCLLKQFRGQLEKWHFRFMDEIQTGDDKDLMGNQTIQNVNVAQDIVCMIATANICGVTLSSKDFVRFLHQLAATSGSMSTVPGVFHFYWTVVLHKCF
jgi:hypothetical protein